MDAGSESVHLASSVLAAVKLKGFSATALSLLFLFFAQRATVAVKIKRDKSIGGWTLGPRVVLSPSLFRTFGPILECGFSCEKNRQHEKSA